MTLTDSWNRHGGLKLRDLDVGGTVTYNEQFGSTLFLESPLLFVGCPACGTLPILTAADANPGVPGGGAVFVYFLNGTQPSHERICRVAGTQPSSSLGSSLSVARKGLWLQAAVGAPGSNTTWFVQVSPPFDTPYLASILTSEPWNHIDLGSVRCRKKNQYRGYEAREPNFGQAVAYGRETVYIGSPFVANTNPVGKPGRVYAGSK